MRILLGPLAAAALLAAVGTASAAQEKTAEIDRIDTRTATIVDADGDVFKVAPSVNLGEVQPTFVYNITYDVVKGQRVAINLEMVPPPDEDSD